MDAGLVTALTGLLAAFGAGFAWLWTRISTAKQKHREEIAKAMVNHQRCELELATLRAEMTAQGKELAVVQGTCSTLTELLRKESHFGGT